MRIIVLLIAAGIALQIIPLSDSQAAGDFPICYWELIDEGRYVYRYNYDSQGDWNRLSWREIRNRRELNRTASEKPKLLELRCTDYDALFGEHAEADCKNSYADSTERGTVLIRDPDGKVSRLSGFTGDAWRVKLPADEQLNGRYLLGGCFNFGVRDVDGDGAPETVHGYAKRLVVHMKSGGTMGGSPDVFFDNEDMPLEIAPYISSAQSKYGGGTQSPHNRYEMVVRYRNKPLAGAAVRVFADDSGWQKTFTADGAGKIEIMPFDDRSTDRNWQRLLFVAAHHDREQGAFHIASLPIVVYRNRPEWRSEIAGFGSWTIVGGVGCLILVPGIARRRRRLQEAAMASFRNYKIKED
jgi:hypothetical protein